MKIILSFSFLLLAVSCSSTRSNVRIDTTEWYLDPPKSSNVFYTVGYAQVPTPAALNLTRKKAVIRAREELASIIEVQILSVTERSFEQIGIGRNSDIDSKFRSDIKAITKQTLKFSEIEEAELVNDRYFVLISYNVNSVQEALRLTAKQSGNFESEFETWDVFSGAIDQLTGTTGIAAIE